MIIPYIGQAVIWIIMACCVVGGIAAIRDEESELGREFMLAFHQMGSVFIPVAGVMASAPFIAKFIEVVFGAIYGAIGADLAMAPGTLVAMDMGGYQLADALASSDENWIMGTMVCYLAGPLISFSIPVAFSMLPRRDHKYYALGIMAGILTIPIGVLVGVILINVTKTPIRGEISTDSIADTILHFDMKSVLLNLIPLIVFCIILALLLRFLTDLSVKIFLKFGVILGAAIKLVLIACIVEYFTGVFSMIFGSWGFDPIIADEVDLIRALEVTGFIALMVSGAYPMIYLLRKYLEKPIRKIGYVFGFSPAGSVGLLATMANLLALFRLEKDLTPEDKVKCIAFSVGAAWLLGDHLSFTANFQPNLVAIIMVMKLSAAVCAVLAAYIISVPVARRYEREDRATGIIGADEYIDIESLTPRQIKEGKGKDKDDISNRN